MPAKKTKPRKISQQNRDILRRNFNKKFIQLQHLIYELSSASEELNLQRIFIQDWYNQRIDHALSVYRNQIDKLQKTSVEDFKFIVERTDRFYQRKIKNLKNEEEENIQKVQNDLNLSNNNASEDDINNIKNLISSISDQLENETKEFEKNIELNKQMLINQINEEKAKGDQIILDYLKETEEKCNLYEVQFNEKVKNMEIQHEIELNAIQNEFGPFSNNLNTNDYQKVELFLYQNQISDLKLQFQNELNRIKAQISQEIEQIRTENEIYKNQYLELNNQIENNEYDQIISEFKTDFDKIKKENITQLNNLKNSYEELIKKNQSEIETLKITATHNQQNEGSSLDFLRNQLNSTFELVQQRIIKEQQKYQTDFALYEDSIRDNEKQFSEQCLQLKKELSNNKIQYQRVVVSTQKSFLMEKEALLTTFKESIAKIKNDFFLLQTNQNQTEIDYRSNLNNLKIEKELEMQTNLKQISDFDSNFQSELEIIKNQYEADLDSYRKEMSELLEKDNLDNHCRIEELDQKHKEAIENFKKSKENENTKQIELISGQGYSKSEYEEIDSNYQKEYESLQNQLQESRIIMPESDSFKNMLRVISDLQTEKADHETINLSRKNCLNGEWNDKIENENKRHSQALSKLVINPRLRDEAKRRLKHKIETVQKEKNDSISHLNQVLADLQKKRNVFQDLDDEIEKLQSILDRLPSVNEETIQKAIKDRDDLIKDTKLKIDQYPMIMNSRKKDAGFLINGQKTIYSEKTRKINESHNAFMKKNEKAYKSEIKQHQTKANNLRTEFQQQKSGLENEIHSIQEKVHQKISESLTQEMRDQWTQQRADLDSQLMNLRNKYEAQLLQLRNEKEEIIQKYDKMWKDKLDIKMKLMKMAENWTVRSPDIDILEKELQNLTIQLTKSTNSLKKYKMMYMDQEKQINPSLGPVPNLVLLPKNYQDLV